MAGKYTPLENYLRDLPKSQREVALDFEQVERIFIEEFGKSSFNVLHKVWKGDALAIEARETRVWAGKHPDDPSRIKSKPIPDEVVTRLRGKKTVDV